MTFCNQKIKNFCWRKSNFEVEIQSGGSPTLGTSGSL